MDSSGSLTWSARERPLPVSNAAELNRALDRISGRVHGTRPIIATLEAHESEALIGVGAEQSFVQLRSATGDGPYWITSAPTAVSNVVAFWLHGDHHTEVPCRYLVAPSVARAALQEFLRSGARFAGVNWVEVGS